MVVAIIKRKTYTKYSVFPMVGLVWKLNYIRATRPIHQFKSPYSLFSETLGGEFEG